MAKNITWNDLKDQINNMTVDQLNQEVLYQDDHGYFWPLTSDIEYADGSQIRNDGWGQTQIALDHPILKTI